MRKYFFNSVALSQKAILKINLWILILFFAGSEIKGQEKENVVSKVNPLASLPSKFGPHVETIKALGDDAWTDLGSPAADPKWGKARGRSYSPKMAYAADLGGAFLCATGVHGFVKPDGHFMDDLWFYDVYAHSWICLYPGASKETKLKLNEHGFEVTETGVSQPVSYFSHGYNNLTYLPNQKKLMLIYTNSPWWSKALPQRADWLEIPEKDRSNAYSLGKLKFNVKHPLFWNVEKNCFEQLYVEGEGPKSPRFESVLEYLPTIQKAMWIDHTKPWFFEPVSGKWDDAKATNVPVDVYCSVGCYDSKRDRVYIVRSGKLYAYGVQSKLWETLSDCPVTTGDVYGQINYDTTSDVVVALVWSKPKTATYKLGAYNYDPITNKWSESAAEMPKLVSGVSNAFFSKELNAHFIHTANDSRDDGKILVYRHKRVKESKDPIEEKVLNEKKESK